MQANSANFSERSTITDWHSIIYWKTLLENHLIEYPMQAGIWSTNPPLKIKTCINIQDSISRPYLLLKSHLSFIQDILACHLLLIYWGKFEEKRLQKKLIEKQSDSESELKMVGEGKIAGIQLVGKFICRYCSIKIKTKTRF